MLCQDRIQNFTIRFWLISTKLRRNSELGAPVLAAGGSLAHDRFNSRRSQRLGHFFHLAGASLPVQHNSPDHVVGKSLKKELFVLPLLSRERM